MEMDPSVGAGRRLPSRPIATRPGFQIEVEPRMPPLKIAYLGLFRAARPARFGAWERYLAGLAERLVDCSRGTVSVELIACDRRARRWPLTEGVVLNVLPAVGHPRRAWDQVSWELPSAVAAADLVHIQAPFTRVGEVGLLAAKQQRKPVCFSEHGAHLHCLSRQLALIELADVVVCHSEQVAARLRTTAPVEVIDHELPLDGRRARPRRGGAADLASVASRLLAIYSRLAYANREITA